ncbi:MAG: heme exporter protein CcmD [Rhodospirillaceae bacterium]|nr:heme exporter protein CcmD [Rhodospirillaceae bacterium]
MGGPGGVDWHALLVLNGYGRYVWPAYGVALVVLVAVTVQSLRTLRRRRAALEALLPTEGRARRRTPPPAAERPASRPPASGPRPGRPA